MNLIEQSPLVKQQSNLIKLLQEQLQAQQRTIQQQNQLLQALQEQVQTIIKSTQ